jgi:hypothetical protein
MKKKDETRVKYYVEYTCWYKDSIHTKEQCEASDGFQDEPMTFDEIKKRVIKHCYWMGRDVEKIQIHEIIEHRYIITNTYQFQDHNDEIILG